MDKFIDKKDADRIATVIMGVIVVVVMLTVGHHIGDKFEKNKVEKEKANKEVVVPKKVVKHEVQPINKKVFNFIKEIGIKYPDVVYAQALIESSHFTNRHFREKNNIFGMKKAVRRTTLGIGDPDKFVYFKSIEEAIIDYKLYQMQFIHKVHSKEEYIDSLVNRGYCKGKGYKNLILKVIASCNIK